jgi:hypothetical protein
MAFNIVYCFYKLKEGLLLLFINMKDLVKSIKTIVVPLEGPVFTRHAAGRATTALGPCNQASL